MSNYFEAVAKVRGMGTIPNHVPHKVKVQGVTPWKKIKNEYVIWYILDIFTV